MPTHLARFFRARRAELGVGLGPLARRLGYRNLSKGARRIRDFEGGGRVNPGLLAGLAGALENTRDEVRRLSALDYRDWLARADEPVRPNLVLRRMACVYQRVELPDESLSPGTAESFAVRLARERGLRVCPVWSGRHSVYFETRGSVAGRREAAPGERAAPRATTGGKEIRFLPAPRSGRRPGGDESVRRLPWVSRRRARQGDPHGPSP